MNNLDKSKQEGPRSQQHGCLLIEYLFVVVTYLRCVFQYLLKCLIGNLTAILVLQPRVQRLQQIHHHRTTWEVLHM